MRNDTQMLTIMITDQSRPSRSPVAAMVVSASALISGLEEVSKRCAGTAWAISTVSPHDPAPGRFVSEQSAPLCRTGAPGWAPKNNWP